MADAVSIAGAEYISSKRASELSGYSQDYIGQLARASLIDANRVSGLWYVSLESLNSYREKSDTYEPIPPANATASQSLETVVSLDGKDYISAHRASEITGYHQDYVGQLARNGKVASRQIGKRWFVDRASIEKHKEEKDALLAAVQVEAVGLIADPEAAKADIQPAETFFNYTSDEDDLLPHLSDGRIFDQEESETVDEISNDVVAIPIRVKSIVRDRVGDAREANNDQNLASPPKTKQTRRFTLIIVVIIAVLISLFGAFYYLGGKKWLSNSPITPFLAQTAEFLEDLVAQQLVYTRS